MSDNFESIQQQISKKNSNLSSESKEKMSILENEIKSISKIIENQELNRRESMSDLRLYVDARVHKSEDIMRYLKILGSVLVIIVSLFGLFGYKSISDIAAQTEGVASAKLSEIIDKSIKESRGSADDLKKLQKII